jgi:hypothetical protein
MRVVLVAVVVIVAGSACAPLPASLRLEPEQRTVLHVGDVGAARVPPEHDYSIGVAGSSVVFLKKAHQGGAMVYFYRADRAGEATLVATPRDRQRGQCISCVTVRYFVTVVP